MKSQKEKLKEKSFCFGEKFQLPTPAKGLSIPREGLGGDEVAKRKLILIFPKIRTAKPYCNLDFA